MQILDYCYYGGLAVIMTYFAWLLYDTFWSDPK